MVTNPETLATNQEAWIPTLLDFPRPEEIDDARRNFAEYAILGGMLQAKPSFIQAGANTDWTFPMSEAIARACVDAWERHGAESDEAWRCHCSAYLMRYTGRSPLRDADMHHWVFYLLGIYRMQFDKAGLDATEQP